MAFLKPYKFFLIPVILAFLFSSFYIIASPGELKSDALEYDKLADSILVGQYSLDGVPSMLREPGYSVFRAAIKIVGDEPTLILWVQALLHVATVLMIGLTIFKMAPQTGSLGTWGAALAYGLAFYPSHHLSETLTAFLLSVIGLLLISALHTPKRKHWVLLGLFSGLLLLTRFSFLLIPVICAIASTATIFKNKMGTKKEAVTGILVMFLIIAVIISPWIIRNNIQFEKIGVASRSGLILYARAWKAEKSWRSLADSYISVFLGRGLLFTLYPSNQSIFQEQWGDWWRNPEQIKLWGNSQVEIDNNRQKAATEIIFKNFNQFSKFVLWSGVDGLRLLALPNPIIEAQGSPIEGTYGPLAKEGGLSAIQIIALILVHLVQLFWFIAIVASTVIGFRKYGWKFVPNVILIGFLLPHLVIDGTARFGVPIQPWLLSGIFITILYPLYSHYFLKLGALRQS